MKQITGHLAEKNGKWYAVINLYTPEGKRKEKWHGLDLEVAPGNKREANKRFAEVLSKYNVGDLYLEQSLTKSELERRRIGTLRVDEYLRECGVYPWKKRGFCKKAGVPGAIRSCGIQGCG